MGYHIDHFVTVTGGDEIAILRQQAVDLFHEGTVSLLMAHPINGGSTFTVVPDGSKAGWSDSEAGNAAREAFVEILKTTEGWFQWFVVRKAEDGPFEIIASSDQEGN